MIHAILAGRSTAPHDVALMRSLLREKMQHYVEVVFALADEAAER